MSFDEQSQLLRPLGDLAPAGRDISWSARNMQRSPQLPGDIRARVVDYLSACPVFLAWMEYTRDEIDDRFGVDGGSAIASDGTYYWRLDAIEYIREYGIPVPEDALRHFEELNWIPPSIDRSNYLRIYQELDDLLGGGEVVS